jgi:hypothetical protein
MALWCDLANTIVERISHADVPIPIHCDSSGLIELSHGSFSDPMALLAGAR